MKTEVRNGINVLIEVLNDDLRDGTFTVPGEVSAIGERAFKACRENLTRVNMPQVTTIEDSAFKDCNALTQVYMPNATTIGLSAFDKCIALTQVDMPKATTIGLSAFDSCIALTQVDMPNATTIGTFAFRSCFALTQVDMPKAFSIGARAFSGCRALTQVHMPNATTIERGAFSWCTALTRVDMPNAATIGQSAFCNCSALTQVDMPKATSIGTFAFCNCSALTQVDMPKATTIGEGAFSSCTTLTHVDMPSVTTIKVHAFTDCSSLISFITSDIEEEINRVRGLLPSELQPYVLPKSKDVQGREVERTIEEFYRECPKLIRDLQLIKDLYDAKALNPVKPLMESLVKPIKVTVPGLKCALFAVPYSRNLTDLAAYKEQLQSIKKQFLERYAIIEELEKYIRILERNYPDSFSEKASLKEKNQHQNLRETVQKIIHSLQCRIPISLSAEEKEMITKRKTLLQKISPKIQKELGINPEPAPLPVPEDRDAQENRVLLDEVDRILEELSDKIQGIGTHYEGAYQAAERLHFALTQARNSLKNQLESGYSTRLQALSAFRLRCEQLVAAALPELERDKDLCQYVCDMLKYLANLFIGVARKLGSRATFFNISSESSQSIAEVGQKLQHIDEEEDKTPSLQR